MHSNPDHTMTTDPAPYPPPTNPEPPPTAAGCVIAAFFIVAGAILGYIIASIQFASQIAR